MDTLIKEYAAKFEDEGQTLKNVHMWSDGCAAQFKNKNQFYWLTTGAQKYGIRLAHHFFQSCHGKGPSDSEGAVAKSALRHAELVQGIYVSFKFILKSAEAAAAFPMDLASLLSYCPASPSL